MGDVFGVFSTNRNDAFSMVQFNGCKPLATIKGGND